MAISTKAESSTDEPSIVDELDRWLDFEEQSWESNPIDVDLDYLGVESRRAENCYTDDSNYESYILDRSATGEQWEKRSESGDPSEGGEYDHNTSFPELSDAQTLWFVGRKYDPIYIIGDKHINRKREKRFYRWQTGQQVNGDVANSNDYGQKDNDNYLFVRQIITNILLDHYSDEIDAVIYAALDDPYLNSSWNSHYHGIVGASIGYAGVGLSVDNPTDVIVDRVGVHPPFGSKDGIADAIEYAEKRIAERGIDIFNH